MAYDHNLRQKKNAQKAADEVFEGKSHRDERILLSHASKSTWLATIGVLVVMAVGYWVVNHFGTKGVKSGQNSEAAAVISIETLDKDLNKDLKNSPVEEVESPNSQNSMAEVPAESEVQQVLKPGQLVVDSLPMPNERPQKPQMTFYDEMSELEVPLDDASKYPILLEVPEYIVAGSFYNESSAKRELKRLTASGEELVLVASTGKGDRVVYVLKTKPYQNRRELGARKNALRKLGARVRSYPVKTAE